MTTPVRTLSELANSIYVPRQRIAPRGHGDTVFCQFLVRKRAVARTRCFHDYVIHADRNDAIRATKELCQLSRNSEPRGHTAVDAVIKAVWNVQRKELLGGSGHVYDIARRHCAIHKGFRRFAPLKCAEKAIYAAALLPKSAEQTFDTQHVITCSIGGEPFPK